MKSFKSYDQVNFSQDLVNIYNNDELEYFSSLFHHN